MKILVTGSSGFIGSHLLSTLTQRNHHVVRLLRHFDQLNEDSLLWDPQHHELNPEEFEGFDLVINLAGENIAAKWSPEKKRMIKDSRVLATHMLSELLTRLKNPPKLFISASGIGYYGNRGEEIVDEDSSQGQGFLAELSSKWEKATESLNAVGTRVALLRIGAVLSPDGGMLGKLLPVFKWGLGGVIGSGDQYLSWIAIDDLMGIILSIISNEQLHGVINAVTPYPVTNREFTKTLGKILERPTVLKVPNWLLHLFFGEMADEMLLSSSRAIPKKLMENGYEFLYPHLEDAFRYLLGK